MKLACITGASSGIGKEFAYLLSDLEYDLILVGRNSAVLHEIADNVAVRCKCITCDLSDEKSCVKLGRKLRQYPLDIMINNAGFGELGTFAETKLKNDINMINVNIKAVHILTKAVLPGFIQRDRGYIMNVAKCRAASWWTIYVYLLCNQGLCDKPHYCNTRGTARLKE